MQAASGRCRPFTLATFHLNKALSTRMRVYLHLITPFPEATTEATEGRYNLFNTQAAQQEQERKAEHLAFMIYGLHRCSMATLRTRTITMHKHVCMFMENNHS